MLFFAAGFRAPLLALSGMRRPRNLAVVVLPYAAALAVLAVAGPLLGEADRIGLAAVATAPALLAAASLATAIGGRMDRAGALLVGTIGAWWVLSLVRGNLGPAQNAMLPFIVGAGINSFFPMLHPTARTVIQRLGDLAFLFLIAVAVGGASALNAASGLAALGLFVAIAGTAVIAARVGGVDAGSALAGGGTRDPAVATAIALGLGGSAAIPLYSGFIQLALAATLVVRNRRKAR